MNKQKFWIIVVSKDHAMRGVEGNFIQANHGKQAPLRRISEGDWIIIYSPKISLDGNEKYQCFTAIGQASDENVYQFKMTESFMPFRRNVKFNECLETSILPLINSLEFIPNKKSWGYPFRFGFFEMNENDFNIISSKMLINGKEDNTFL
ncbi:MAG: EVE domain-containing protein [Bacteroidota bacterium]|nr:EVE domain-containing protein [Bacteroidota bacterium]